MSNPSDSAGSLSREQLASALFANLIIQQTNMAFMFLGRVPHPETGKTETDLEAAKFFIDQIEMLEVKTKGNLSADEERLLKQSLMTLRMAFVEAVEQGAPQGEKKPAPATDTKPEPQKASTEPAAPKAEEESHKKFSKKY